MTAPSRYKMLTLDQERELVTRMRAGDMRARDALILSYMPLARKIARQYARLCDPEDLAQEAVLGMMRAAEKFDPDQGKKFGTYARWWIFAAISDYVRLNVSVVDRPHVACWRDLKAGTLAFDRSFDAPLADGADTTRLDRLHDSRVPDDAAIAHRIDMERGRAALRASLGVLSAREKVFITRIYLDDAAETVQQRDLARELGISPQRVQQVHKTAIEKLTARMIGPTPEIRSAA